MNRLVKIGSLIVGVGGAMMRNAFLMAGIAALAGTAWAQPYGIESRVSNDTLRITQLPATSPGSLQFVRMFPRLNFTKSVLMGQIPDGSNRMFHVSQTGRVRVFPKTADPAPEEMQVLLDISGRVLDSGEQGLLGVAFDPDYANNGRIYVSYIYNNGNPGESRLSRFTNDNPADNSIDPDTEEVLLQLQQPYSNHNGGMVAFGPDGMLYFGLGDGGLANDPLNSGQDTRTLLGKMLRLDVNSPPDPGLAYKIPTDNPFYEGGPAGANTRKEIWAYGFRNPWRWSFDLANGFLLMGDVGQDAREEVNHVRRGGNYGWKIREGSICRPGGPTNCQSVGLTPPIAEYVNSGARQSVTGGYVYYGTNTPSLYGVYMFADLNSGEVFGITYNGQTASGLAILASGFGRQIAGFGQDDEGEVYLMDYTYNESGGIWQLRPAGGGGSSNFPTRLSQLPALLAAGSGVDQTDAGIYPYEPSAKLWSDGARKERFLALPGLTTAGYSHTDSWSYPEETIIIKNFILPLDERDPDNSLKRVETRLLYKKNSDWHGFSYEWNDEETDAQLLTASKTKPLTVIDDNGTTSTYNYYFPSRGDCLSCHSNASGRVLGLTTAQMNHTFTYPASGIADNQLRTLSHISVLGALPAPPEELPRMPDFTDTSAPLQDRARAYLASNCSMCHRPAGPTPAMFDVRWETANDAMNAIDKTPTRGDLGISGARIIAPGDPGRSILLQRMHRLDGARMPPLATSRVDEVGTQLIAEWIASLGTPTDAELWMAY